MPKDHRPRHPDDLAFQTLRRAFPEGEVVRNAPKNYTVVTERNGRKIEMIVQDVTDD